MNAGGSGIAYIFESGDEHQDDSDRFIKFATAQKGSPLLDLYQYRSHGYLKKEDARLLETADVLAWEWAKHVERTREGKQMRPSLRELVGPDYEVANQIGLKNEKFFCLHVSGMELERFCDKVGRLLLATEKEQVAEIMASCG